MKVVESITKLFGKSFCNICLKEGKVKHFDNLNLCSECLDKVKVMETEEPFKISKEQTAGGIKDEL